MEKSLIARANELANASKDPVELEQSLVNALLERHGHDAMALARAWAHQERSQLSQIRKRSYHLPKDPTLFDLPPVIVIQTPDGDLLLPEGTRLGKHVKQWVREGKRYHKSQRTRFEKIAEKVEALDCGDDDNYDEAIRAIRSVPEGGVA